MKSVCCARANRCTNLPGKRKAKQRFAKEQQAKQSKASIKSRSDKALLCEVQADPEAFFEGQRESAALDKVHAQSNLCLKK